MVKGCLLGSVLSVALYGPAAGGDISRFDWSGTYVGGHVAYGRGHVGSTLFDPDPSASASTFGNLFGGLQIGYNYVVPSRLLLGVEGDVSFPNFLEDGFISGRTTAKGTSVTDEIDTIGTLRGRFGGAFDHWLACHVGRRSNRKDRLD